jgi:hypothetical protein
MKIDQKDWIIEALKESIEKNEENYNHTGSTYYYGKVDQAKATIEFINGLTREI